MTDSCPPPGAVHIVGNVRMPKNRKKECPPTPCLYHAMCSSHFLSHNQCLLARALASEYFDRQRFASDKRELHLREVLHTLLCPLAQIQSFGCLIRWRFLRQPTTMISASVSTL